MRAHYSEHILHAHSRLDVPTFNDPSVRGQLEAVTSYRASSPWSGIRMLIGILSMITQMMSQLAILITILRDKPDSVLLAGLSFAIPVISQLSTTPGSKGGAWAATCRSLDFLRLQGFKMLVNDEKYRKELVAGDLQNYILLEFHLAQENLGENGDLNFYEAQQELQKRRDMFSILPFLVSSLGELPTVVFTMGAVQSPQSIPVSLASLTLIRQAVDSFSGPLLTFISQSLTISDAFISIRRLHELINIPNQLKTGTEAYPEDQSNLNRFGISVEFMRSTILKLLNRLYDPTEGTILIDGRDIRSLRLNDLRSCISVLFQDYTHFPLSIKENIGIGDPQHAHDIQKIHKAANLGGALDMVEALPEGFDTFLYRPVKDYYSGIPDQTKQLFGRQVDIKRVKRKVGKTHQTELSGGQMQKVALSRTFMRSLPEDTKVGLLLFDEPSASLDPSAEYDLFERLRKLRGNKTMVFSSHRFGNLTRSADLVSVIRVL
ncbi:hypothetical protein Clacol_003635 [Clathrus columnatus]|uniref:ABC transporter domain-containing protein n=1 Tax=Clathrus columnatus TaxID=1419009 RepID=A0AAV5A888_9AGAM|nr:hypothetical protein Clacol_003635 [Clathrus columnatus]